MSPTDTRAHRAIRLVACPKCQAPIGVRCCFGEPEARQLGPRLRSLPIHKERRQAWQIARRRTA